MGVFLGDLIPLFTTRSLFLFRARGRNDQVQPTTQEEGEREGTAGN